MTLRGTVDVIKGGITLEGELTGLTPVGDLAPADPARGAAGGQGDWRSTVAWSTSS